MALSEMDNHNESTGDITAAILHVPSDLKEGHPIDTPAGTWHKDGDVSIFDAGVHLQKPLEKVEHVKDINAYTSISLEREMEAESAKNELNTVRRPLSIAKQVAVSLLTSVVR